MSNKNSKKSKKKGVKTTQQCLKNNFPKIINKNGSLLKHIYIKKCSIISITKKK